MEHALVVSDEVRQALSTAGWDMDKELSELDTESSAFDIPRVRIEHKDTGRHKLYIDYGESYFDDDRQEYPLPKNRLTGVVFAVQFIRALWEEGADVPRCSAIDGIPLGDESLQARCADCEHSAIGGICKPKVRLFLLSEIEGKVKPLVFALSPTSIKHWNAHKKKLHRSNLPVVAVNTTFELEDVKKGTYRWAEVKVSVDGIASKEMLILARQARDQFEEVTNIITQRDFSDPGDTSAAGPF